MTIGLLLSGNLGLILLRSLLKSYDVETVLTDSNSTEIIELCNRNQVACFQGNPRNGRARHFISDKPIDLLLSINYLFLVDEDIINWPKKGAVNFHGSLLPKYRGRTPHVWAIINNEVQTGVTAHYIIKECDEGGIILQEEVQIESNDTGATILNKFKKLYPAMVNKTIQLFKEDKVNSQPQNEKLATYFGKRTPDDGAILWEWSKERIRNWVRAQSYPYPGAFSFYHGEKIIIDCVEYSDIGYHQNDENGKILDIQNDLPIVKTSNGAVYLSKIRNSQNMKFQKGDIFL